VKAAGQLEGWAASPSSAAKIAFSVMIVFDHHEM